MDSNNAKGTTDSLRKVTAFMSYNNLIKIQLQNLTQVLNKLQPQNLNQTPAPESPQNLSFKISAITRACQHCPSKTIALASV